jgi:hypothetical protein
LNLARHFVRKDAQIEVERAQELPVAVDMQVVARIETHRRLIEALGVIEVAVAPEQIQVTLGTRAPLGLQIARAIAESAAAVENDVVAVPCLDEHARRPAAVDPRLGRREPRRVRRQRRVIDRPSEKILDRT